jgi:8-oxo-dGTP diphosphatase
VARELREETGLDVRVLELIEVFERIFPDAEGVEGNAKARPRYHFVILDYLCEAAGGEARPGSDVTDVAWARQDELEKYQLSPSATRVIKRAFAMARTRTLR